MPGVASEKYVLPNCQASVLCEDIRREITGMQTLVGVLNGVPAPQVPVAKSNADEIVAMSPNVVPAGMSSNARAP